MGTSPDDDARREFEQRALTNVHALARRLGRSDALDRYGERFVLIWVGVFVFLVVSAVAVTFVMTPGKLGDEDLKRCEMEVRVRAARDVGPVGPLMSYAEHERLIDMRHRQLRALPENQCGGGRAAK